MRFTIPCGCGHEAVWHPYTSSDFSRKASYLWSEFPRRRWSIVTCCKLETSYPNWFVTNLMRTQQLSSPRSCLSACHQSSVTLTSSETSDSFLPLHECWQWFDMISENFAILPLCGLFGIIKQLWPPNWFLSRCRIRDNGGRGTEGAREGKWKRQDHRELYEPQSGHGDRVCNLIQFISLGAGPETMLLRSWRGAWGQVEVSRSSRIIQAPIRAWRWRL